MWFRRFPSAFSLRLGGRLAVVLSLCLAFTISDARPASIAKPRDGQTIFRFDTFGDEQFWTDTLRLNEVIETSVSPATALSVGLKVDSEALPPNFLAELDDPATTVELIRRQAVLGMIGKVAGGHLTSVGITCAICHSTVDDSVTRGVGRRLDGWPNRDLNPGAIVALSPALTPRRRRSTTPGARASTTRGSTSTGSTGPR